MARIAAADRPAPPALRGARTSCALLTLLTILLAWPTPTPALAVIVRPFYFGLLFWFFRRTARQSPELHGQAMRLVCGGFLVLGLAFLAAALIHFAGLDRASAAFTYLRDVCERGAFLLLGTSLLAFGLMLWIPQVLANHRLLEVHFAQQSGQLELAESTRSELEQRLVDADRRAMLGELAASIAHDLRNPLTIVKGTAESLCRRPRSTNEVAEHTAVIRRNIEKADATLNALIDLGRPRSEASTELDAVAVLREVVELLHVEARRRHVTLRLQHGGGGAVVRTDRALLVQALLNLALNAVQATAQGGTVSLRARRLAGAHRRGVVLAVEDRGHGLMPSVRERVGTPFFTTKQGGTGLGLSSCRRIAIELGGSVGLFPRQRGGARALLLLPAGGASTVATRPIEEPACLATRS
ncbi:MAG: HAMP domain-containing histidine kinase [Planctomycetes bacterium]|nr:HAMP domain-containing histidine kinase [Planctomycetota bacterium]